MYGVMSLTTTGFDSARSIPEGARVTRSYWTVPGDYGDKAEFPSEELALEWALNEARRLGQNRVTVDLRWKLSYPGGGGMDTTIQRNTYSDLSSADEHLGRIRFFSLATA